MNESAPRTGRQGELALRQAVPKAPRGVAFVTAEVNGNPSATFALPATDNTAAGLAALRKINTTYRTRPWPAPLDVTTHRLQLGDARGLAWIPDHSVHLIVTSPPYWTLKKYEDCQGQLGAVAHYDVFLDELDKVWRHCARALVEGGRICYVVGDVCIPRKQGGRHLIVPLHADIQARAEPRAGLPDANSLAQDRQRGHGSGGERRRLLR